DAQYPAQSFPFTVEPAFEFQRFLLQVVDLTLQRLKPVALLPQGIDAATGPQQSFVYSQAIRFFLQLAALALENICLALMRLDFFAYIVQALQRIIRQLYVA